MSALQDPVTGTIPQVIDELKKRFSFETLAAFAIRTENSAEFACAILNGTPVSAPFDRVKTNITALTVTRNGAHFITGYHNDQYLAPGHVVDFINLCAYALSQGYVSIKKVRDDEFLLLRKVNVEGELAIGPTRLVSAVADAKHPHRAECLSGGRSICLNLVGRSAVSTCIVIQEMATMDSKLTRTMGTFAADLQAVIDYSAASNMTEAFHFPNVHSGFRGVVSAITGLYAQAASNQERIHFLTTLPPDQVSSVVDRPDVNIFLPLRVNARDNYCKSDGSSVQVAKVSDLVATRHVVYSTKPCTSYQLTCFLEQDPLCYVATTGTFHRKMQGRNRSVQPLLLDNECAKIGNLKALVDHLAPDVIVQNAHHEEPVAVGGELAMLDLVI